MDKVMEKITFWCCGRNNSGFVKSILGVAVTHA